MEEIYQQAVKDALDETKPATKTRELYLPEACLYTVSGLLEGDLDTLRAMLA